MPLTRAQEKFITSVIEDYLDFPNEPVAFMKMLEELFRHLKPTNPADPGDPDPALMAMYTLAQILLYPQRYFLRLEHHGDQTNRPTKGEVTREAFKQVTAAVSEKARQLNLAIPWSENLIHELNLSDSDAVFSTEIIKEVELSPWELKPLTDRIYQHHVAVFKRNNLYRAKLEVTLWFQKSYSIHASTEYGIQYMDETPEYWKEFRSIMKRNAESLALELMYENLLTTYPGLVVFFPPLSGKEYLFGLITHQFYFPLIINSNLFFRRILQLTPDQAAFFKEANIVKLQRENLVNFEQLEMIRSPAHMQRLCAPAAYALLSERVCDFFQLLGLSKATYQLISSAFYTNLLVGRSIAWEDCSIESEELVKLLCFPTILNAITKGTLAFSTALKLSPCMRELFTSSCYAEYFSRADCNWSEWTSLQPYHLRGFLHPQLAPLLSQRELLASSILGLQAHHFVIFDDPTLCAMVKGKKIRLIEVALMSKVQIEILMHAPILMALLEEAPLHGSSIISIFQATSIHLQRQKAYAKAFMIIYFRYQNINTEKLFNFLQIMINASSECGVKLDDFLQAFVHEIAHRQRLLLNDTGIANTINRQHFNWYLLQLNSLFDIENAALDTALDKLQSLISAAQYALEILKKNPTPSPSFFSSRTPLEKLQTYLQSITGLKPLLERIHHCLSQASVGRSLRSPMA